jgi:hypothetical protein
VSKIDGLIFNCPPIGLPYTPSVTQAVAQAAVAAIAGLFSKLKHNSAKCYEY